MAVKKSKASSSEGDSKLFAFLATFLSILGFIIALLAKKDDSYVMFYAKQSLVLFLAGVILSIIAIIPILGWIIYIVGGIILFVLWIISWVYALSGEQKEVPLLGKYAEKFNL